MVFQDIIVSSDFVRIKTFSGGQIVKFFLLVRVKTFSGGQTVRLSNLSELKRFSTDNCSLETTCP